MPPTQTTTSRLPSAAEQLPSARAAVPVIVLTGYLGAGKTSVLNHLLRHPAARIGVIVNDFGELNVDVGLISGQVNEPVSISGGCICCLTDAGGMEDALIAMAAPALGLDAIIVEASGFAEPLILARMISRWGRSRFRLGGLIDVVDACAHFDTVDSDELPPVRYAAVTLVLVNKLDLVPEAERTARLERIRSRVHARNPRAAVLGTVLGRIDPHLLFDGTPAPEAAGASAAAPPGEKGRGSAGDWQQAELPLQELFMEAYASRDEALLAALDSPVHDHVHARSVTVEVPGAVSAAAVLDLLENLPVGAYRAKGVITVPTERGPKRFVVQAVGPNVFAAAAGPGQGTGAAAAGSALVIIGAELDETAARAAAAEALAELPADGPAAPGLERIRTLIRLHG